MAEYEKKPVGVGGGAIIAIAVIWGFFLIFLYNNLTNDSNIGAVFAKDPLFGLIISFFRWLW
ncbi:hypothetical protein A2999_02100 [Candidatus Wolfebacteria bacterium RIFCSPLOWO2_01_FULL_38_11]|uniref:Uncharacterized protein n=2 Tax=Candidatus Wolfeibacteriota TaxID=1752735 RepID=A0A0G0IDL6_9BACT|nr:MAG: hypothetical protein US36_C0008G0006 [Candidatus Wolfebacteria bacterium GW2011_GWC1_37_10]OGM92018.1 MAG: hypothetical protein A2999_02100 [Candidatus Wolfebacteria bacterium RIFCSPLOWO2_01_FULL_38_11]